jgi:hypothetical protein
MKLTSLLDEHCPLPKKKCVKLSHFTLDKHALLLLYMVPNFSSFQSNIKYNILKKKRKLSSFRNFHNADFFTLHHFMHEDLITPALSTTDYNSCNTNDKKQLNVALVLNLGSSLSPIVSTLPLVSHNYILDQQSKKHIKRV